MKKINQSNSLSGEKLNRQVIRKFQNSNTRLIVLDYDGTLMEFKPTPPEAKPTKNIIKLIKSLISNKKNTVAIITGREKANVEEWFGRTGAHLFAEHGIYMKVDGVWKTVPKLSDKWKPEIYAKMEYYTSLVKGTFIEEKDFALAWHYRKADQMIAKKAVNELINEVNELIIDKDLLVLQGNKVVEVKNSGANKGDAVRYFTNKKKYEFVLVIGDDVTDEDMFRVVSEDTITVKVGNMASIAKYRLKDPHEVRQFLNQLL